MPLPNHKNHVIFIIRNIGVRFCSFVHNFSLQGGVHMTGIKCSCCGDLHTVLEEFLPDGKPVRYLCEKCKPSPATDAGNLACRLPEKHLDS